MKNEANHAPVCGTLAGVSAFRRIAVSGLLACGLIAISPLKAAQAQASNASWRVQAISNGQVSVPLYKSQIIDLKKTAKKVSVGNPEIADILILNSRQIYVVGKALGTTNVVLWGSQGRVSDTIDVEVTHDLVNLKEKLFQLMPQENIQVRASQGSIVLSGEVSSVVKMQAAMDLAQSFMPLSRGLVDTKGDVELKGGQVLNLMQVGGAQQIMLEVKVAEMSRTILKKLDVNFNAFGIDRKWRLGAVNGGASFPDAVIDVPRIDPVSGQFDSFVSRRVPIFGGGTPIGPAVTELRPNIPTIDDNGLFASYLSGDFLFNLVIDAAREEGLAKILAEPTLTTQTGQEARFLSGGEFPIPVPQSQDTVTIEFKEFGVGLQFLPVVLDSGRISLKLNVSVSELSSTSQIVLGVTNSSEAFFVPSLTKRSASSTVELNDGQTLGIAGLINENLREAVNKFPGLGDMPVLGPLFRSQEFRKGMTELVIFVTPRFARPIRTQTVRLPTDSFVEPSDIEFYLMGRLEGRKQEKGPSSVETGGTSGSFGHGM
jgi:pilus assembly protein CpaC